MKKTTKISLRLIVILCLGFMALRIASGIEYDLVQSGHEKLQLSRISSAVQELGSRNRLTPDVLHRLAAAETPTKQLAQQLGLDEASLFDNRGDRYSIQMREKAGIIFLLIRSGYIPPDRWFRGKQEDLGIEIVITKFDGKVVQVRYLWDGD
jgi:hypothetical protein